MVSARVPSHFKRGLPATSCCKDGNAVMLSTVGKEVFDSGSTRWPLLHMVGYLGLFKMRDVRICMNLGRNVPG
jgi:hypothetical protein